MPFGLLNGVMLFGLVVLAIPLLIHLFNRRRYDVVDWAAMRFLEISKTTRRRIWIEEPLLMLLRMGLLALFVLALAAPFIHGLYVHKLGITENRDVVLIFDGSTGMSWVEDDGGTTQDEALTWARQFVDKLTPGDKVAVLQARELPVAVVGELTPDRDAVRTGLERVPTPGGEVDWPAAVEAANRLLESSVRARRDIVLIGSGRFAGWADPATLKRWDLLAPHLSEARVRSRIWAVPLGKADQDANENWSLGPVRLGKSGDSIRSRDNNQSRVTTRREFNATLKVSGPMTAPFSLRYEIDAPPGTKLVEEGPQSNTGSISLPPGDTTLNPALPLEFKYTFATPGSHLVSVVVEPDLPADKRPLDYKIRDRLAGDNRRYFALNLPRVPVLLCDTALETDPGLRPSWFLQRVFPLEDKPDWLVRAQVRPLEDLEKALSQDLNNEANSRPRVLVLCDLDAPVDPKDPANRLPPLTEAQSNAVDRFVRAGGGVLITLGPRADSKAWNTLYKGRDGWLPTRLLEAVGKVDDRERAARPDLNSFRGPALEPFHRPELASLANARFPRWWRLATPAGTGARVVGSLDSGVVFQADDRTGLAGLMTSKSPLIVEKQLGKGRVMLCSVPLNDSWNTNVHETQQVPVFPVLAYELVGHLAGQRAVDANLAPGQPLVYQPLEDESAEEARLQTPTGTVVPLHGQDGRFTFKDTRLPGVYLLTTSRNRTVYYVVESSATPSAADLRLCTPEERAKVAEHAPGLVYAEAAEPILAGPDRDLWWLGLLVVVLLLCGEVWMTRQIVKNR